MILRGIVAGAGSLLISGAAGAGAGAPLFDSTVGVDPAAYAVVSSAFTDNALGGFQAAGADDFSVAATGWRIDEIRVGGNYSDPLNAGNAGPAASVNVYILPKSGATPASTDLQAAAVWAGQGLSYTDLGVGDFSIALPGVVLAGGDYWLVVQANIELLAVGQWNWTESALTPNSGTTQGDESAWFQSAAGVASPITGTATCVATWGARVTGCQMSRNPDSSPPLDRDFAFAILGDVLVPGVTVTPLSLVTTEDGSAVNYSVVLNAPPESGETVTVTPSSSDTTEGTVSAALVFNQANWSEPQTVTVTPGASGDGNDGDVQYSIDHAVLSSVSGGGYDGASAPAVAVINNNIEGIATIIVDPSSALTVSEDGVLVATVTFSAGSSFTPSSDVSVSVVNNNPGDIALSASTVVLTAANGFSSSLTVSGLADDVREATESFSISTASATSADAAFNGVDPADISGTVLDSNVVNVVATPNVSPLSLSESGPAGSIGYVLTARPTSDVSFTVSSSDPGQASISGVGVLTFTPANWNFPQTVSIAPVNDAIVDGTQSFSILATPTSSADPFWNAVSVPSVAGSVTDNETAAIAVDIGDGIATQESGSTDTFSIVLGAQPAGDVGIDVRSSDPGEGLLSLTGAAPFAATQTLTFTPANWNVPQTVTVAGQDDGIPDGDQAFTILTENIVSSAPGYAGLGDADVADVPAVNAGALAPAPPTVVPALSEGMLALLVLLMASIAGFVLQRRGQV